ncbi:O-methyltransferase [Peniophora sp. CONT]|nr:O-methyltransferase [Peniophora sp. CONT]
MTTVHESLGEIKGLAAIIQGSIARIEEALIEAGKPNDPDSKAREVAFPSSHSPWSRESEAGRMIPAVLESISVLVAAASQLINATRPPTLTLTTVATSAALPASLGVAARAHVAEICHEAGEEGVHVNDIAKVSGISPKKLARVLRLLATDYIFVELSPDVFTNNCVSSLLNSNVAVKDIIANPEAKHSGRSLGGAAAVGHCTDECMKAAAYMSEAMFDPPYAKSGKPTETALNIAFKTDLSAFEWLEIEGNEQRLARFTITMDASRRVAPDAAIAGFNWKDLADDALIVDVGGGVGSQCMVLADAFKDRKFRFVVQDRKAVIKEAATFWAKNVAFKEGRVLLQEHDFFDEQPQKNADVFFLRWVLHDWSDGYCLDILKQLRAAAKASTRLVIVDSLIPYACIEDETESIPGAQRPVPPRPLLPNLGQFSALTYFTDIQVMNTLNGQERTITQVKVLMEEAGWKLVNVHLSNFPPSSSKAIAVPV